MDDLVLAVFGKQFVNDRYEIQMFYGNCDQPEMVDAYRDQLFTALLGIMDL